MKMTSQEITNKSRIIAEEYLEQSPLGSLKEPDRSTCILLLQRLFVEGVIYATKDEINNLKESRIKLENESRF